MAQSDLETLQAGDAHYKAYVGPPMKYDLMGALQFNMLTAAGLRGKHTLCDIGCGSLRVGKMLIPFLDTGNYFGLEPNKWLVNEGIEKELGKEILKIKKPKFAYNDIFDLSAYSAHFDFIIAQSIFSHASPKQIRQCLGSAREKMLPKSLFLATFLTGDTDYSGSDWVYPGCVIYRPETIEKMARAAGLIAIKADWPHPNGQSWYLLGFPENAEEVRQKAHFSLWDFRYSPPPPPAEPTFMQKVVFNLKQIFAKL